MMICSAPPLRTSNPKDATFGMFFAKLHSIKPAHEILIAGSSNHPAGIQVNAQDPSAVAGFVLNRRLEMIRTLPGATHCSFGPKVAESFPVLQVGRSEQVNLTHCREDINHHPLGTWLASDTVEIRLRVHN